MQKYNLEGQLQTTGVEMSFKRNQEQNIWQLHQ